MGPGGESYQIVYENTDNNCTYGVSDLKIGHIITPEFVIENSASNTFTWKTVNTNNPVDINDSVDISYYIQSGRNSENHDISNTGSVNINNQDEFYRRFSIPIKKRIDLKKINFVYQTNIDSDSSSISNVIFNKESNFEFNFENVNNSIKNDFDNYQKFRNVVKEEFIRIN